MNTRIAVVIGTGREDRRSVHIAQYIAEELKKRPEAPEVHLIDPREYLISPFTVPAWVADENASKWRNIAAQMDAFVLVVPEYNHSFPGELKLLLDSAFKEYADKPVGLVGVSDGQYGGTRALEHVLALVATLKMYAVPYTVAISNIPEISVGEGETVFTEQRQQFLYIMFNGIFNHISK